MARRLGSARMLNTDSTLCIYATRHIRVKGYIKNMPNSEWLSAHSTQKGLEWATASAEGNYSLKEAAGS